jgi:NAD(P)-dependent dehydrogenase (short-subunit alcohol dehydrogenase family)
MSTSPVAIVTGASRGIGAACARALAEAGYAVVINYRSESAAADAIAGEVNAAGGQAITVKANVGDPGDVAALFEAADAAFGAPDVLVNNAGISGPRCRIEDLGFEDLQAMLAINVMGPVMCSQAAIRRMSTNHGGRGGSIINISSGSAYIGNAGNGVHYAVTKGALNSFNIGASQELIGEGIRVNAVSPGMTETDMTSDRPASTFANLPMGRAAQPQEIASAVVWLASDGASYVAGANIRVGGGRP